MVFHNYSIIILGNMNKWNINVWLKNIVWLLSFFIISIIIGIPRLYIIWLLYAIWDLCGIFTFNYHDYSGHSRILREKDIIEKIKYIFNFSWVSLFIKCISEKYEEIYIN